MESRENLEAGKRAQQLPASTQFAIVKCLPNIPYGCNWGFATDDEIRDRFESLKTDKNMIARKVANGCIIEVVPEYLLKSANMVQRGLVKKEHIEQMKQKIAEAYAGLDKYLGSKKGAYVGEIGVYCINSSTSIVIKGKTYPAFRVSLSNAIDLLTAHGYSVGIKGVGYVPASALKSNMQKVYSSMIISPTDTGVFLKIKR